MGLISQNKSNPLFTALDEGRRDWIDTKCPPTMIVRIGSPRSVKQPKSPPSLRTIPENESCLDDKCRSFVDLIDDPATLVRMERAHRSMRPFTRSLELDFLARIHTMHMAAARSVFHSVRCVAALQTKLLSEKVGENVQRGEALGSMHFETMTGDSINRSNILSSHFDEFGSATAVGADGKLYSCQYFRKKHTSRRHRHRQAASCGKQSRKPSN